VLQALYARRLTFMRNHDLEAYAVLVGREFVWRHRSGQTCSRAEYLDFVDWSMDVVKRASDWRYEVRRVRRSGTDLLAEVGERATIQTRDRKTGQLQMAATLRVFEDTWHKTASGWRVVGTTELGEEWYKDGKSTRRFGSPH